LTSWQMSTTRAHCRFACMRAASSPFKSDVALVASCRLLRVVTATSLGHEPPPAHSRPLSHPRDLDEDRRLSTNTLTAFAHRCDLCLVMLGDGCDARRCAVAIFTIGIFHWAPEGSRAPAGDWKGPWVSSRCVMDRYWQISRVAGRYVMGWSEEDVVVRCSFGGGSRLTLECQAERVGP